MSWNWQEWVVALLILLCVFRMVSRIYTFFRQTRKNESPCSTCVSGCELKNQLGRKQSDCKEKDQRLKKKCCG